MAEYWDHVLRRWTPTRRVPLLDHVYYSRGNVALLINLERRVTELERAGSTAQDDA